MEHLFNCHGEWALAGPIAGSVLYVKYWIEMRLQK
jgi:hypothetical protein